MRLTSAMQLDKTIIALAALMTACEGAQAQNACSDAALKDVFIQGGQQLIGDGQVKITSLSRGGVVGSSDRSLTCRYLMGLSDGSQRWVRFTYTPSKAGVPAIDYKEETTPTSR